MSKMMKKVLVVLLLLIITYLHYSAAGRHFVLHVVHRELYLIPIFFAAFWFGKKGGLLLAVISSFLFLPRVLMAERISSASGLNDVLEVVTFIVVAYLLGYFQDVRRSHSRTFFKAPHRTKGDPRLEHGHAVLVCIDNSPHAGKAAEYIVDTFLQHEDTRITVAGFIREPAADVFPSVQEYEKARNENEQLVNKAVEEARLTLLSGGFPEKALTTKSFSLQKKTIAEKVMEEQQQSLFDTVVLAGVKMSKAQEFIFGNTAVKLVREGGPSVVTVF